MADPRILSEGAERATRFAESWVAAWNAHDLDRVMDHYSPGVVFTSPLITERADRTLRSASDLRTYFEAALARNPGLRFELTGAFAGVDSVTVLYRTHRGTSGAEFMAQADDLVIRGAAHYGRLSGP